MTRKHYIAIANIIRQDLEQNGDNDTLERVAKELATILKADNRAFDRDRFLTACGVA